MICRLLKSAFFASLVVLAIGLPALCSTVYYVNCTMPDDSKSGKDSWANAKKTVTAALAAAASGDEIWVASGTYVERIHLKAEVGLYGGFAGNETARNQRDWKSNVTILDGNQGGAVVVNLSSDTAATVIDGFTIRNGSSYQGGGIDLGSSSSATVSHNTITANSAEYGGAIAFSDCNPTITCNIITGNHATEHGGAIYASSAWPTVANNLIANNTAVENGGGIYCYSTYSSMAVVNNTITGNSAFCGGGIYCEGSFASITNNIVAFNSPGIYNSAGAAPTLSHNDVFGNTSYNYSGLAVGTGDISSDPLFANRAAADYWLLDTSPCINAGLDSAVVPGWGDVNGRTRVLFAHVDMGAYEWQGHSPQAVSLNPNSGVLAAGAKQTLASVYTDLDGYSDLMWCNLLINTSLTCNAAACVTYNANYNKVYLRDDADTTWGTGYAPGSNFVLQNSQCKLYCAETTVSGSGNNLAINWKLEFKPSMCGKACKAWMLASDRQTIGIGWVEKGNLRFDQAPAIVSLSPASGKFVPGAKQMFTSVCSDADGASDIAQSYLLIGTALSGKNAAYVCYDAKTNLLYLRNDANTGWGAGAAPGSATVLQNSQCKLYCAETTRSASGNNLTINWKIEFKPTMGGKSCTAWLYATDAAGLATAWAAKGSFGFFSPPVATSLAPNSGTIATSVKQTFASVYSDLDGTADLAQCCLLINTTFSGKNAAYVSYDPKANLLYVRNDGNSSWGVGAAPGSATVLQNSQCKLYCAETTKSASGTNLTINWRIEFRPIMMGKSCTEWLYVVDQEGLTSPWSAAGGFAFN